MPNTRYLYKMLKVIVITLLLIAQLGAFETNESHYPYEEAIRSEFARDAWIGRAGTFLQIYEEKYEGLANVKLFLMEVDAAIQVKLHSKFAFFDELLSQGKALPNDDSYSLAYRLSQGIKESLEAVGLIQEKFSPEHLLDSLKSPEHQTPSGFMSMHMRNVGALMKLDQQISGSIETIYDYYDSPDEILAREYGYSYILDKYAEDVARFAFFRGMRENSIRGLMRAYVELAKIPDAHELLQTKSLD